MVTTTTRYDELCETFPLRPINSIKLHRKAIEILIQLAGERDRDSRDYKSVLTKLVADYELESGSRIETACVKAADVVRHLLDERDMTVSALAKEIGASQGTLNDTLLGKRQWSKTLIVKVADYFNLSTDLFLRPGR